MNRDQQSQWKIEAKNILEQSLAEGEWTEMQMKAFISGYVEGCIKRQAEIAILEQVKDAVLKKGDRVNRRPGVYAIDSIFKDCVCIAKEADKKLKEMRNE